jgi:hypothetical protein
MRVLELKGVHLPHLAKWMHGFCIHLAKCGKTATIASAAFAARNENETDPSRSARKSIGTVIIDS